METPSSTRRVTRSQTLASSANSTNLLLSKKFEDSEKSLAKSRKNQQQDRSALIDITNDSPIVGLAMGNLKTPSSAVSKKKMSNGGQFVRTPGSGEALLRGQVKTLLQKVEEEAEMSKITLENRPFFNLHGLVNYSPMNLAAPTPANTPQVLNLSAENGDHVLIPQMMIEEMVDEKKQDIVECENVITRSLLLDFSEKSDSSECSSVLTYQGVVYGEREKASTDDDDASVWSMQVNAASSTRDEEEVEGCLDEECCEDDYDDDYYYEEDQGLLDDLCEGISKMNVGEAKFMGKHIRFVYNSDDEIEEESSECSKSSYSSLSSAEVLHLKGLPTPKGKHLRFPQESEEN